MDSITTIFYTKPYCNPEVQITAPTMQNVVNITILHTSHIFSNDLKFAYKVHWPCHLSINFETGKVEVKFQKILSKIWHIYGTLSQSCTPAPSAEEDANARVKYIVINKVMASYNTSVLALLRADGVMQTVPIGKYVKVYAPSNDHSFDQSLVRYYTPIPSTYLSTLPSTSCFCTACYLANIGNVCLLVKCIHTGRLSSWLTSRSVGDTLELSGPLGNFDLKLLENREAVLLLAGGTGISPIMGLIGFLLERTQTKCQKVFLLFFNRTEEDILCRAHFDKIQREDNRFTVQYVLTAPPSTWTGLSGHMSISLLKSTVDNLISGSHLQPADVFSCMCGPPVFTSFSKTLLGKMGFKQDDMYAFDG